MRRKRPDEAARGGRASFVVLSDEYSLVHAWRADRPAAAPPAHKRVRAEPGDARARAAPRHARARADGSARVPKPNPRYCCADRASESSEAFDSPTDVTRTLSLALDDY